VICLINDKLKLIQKKKCNCRANGIITKKRDEESHLELSEHAVVEKIALTVEVRFCKKMK